MIVDKIQAYLERTEQTLDDALLIAMQKEKFNVEKLAGLSFERQFLQREPSVSQGKLRLSASGKCARQLAYSYHGIPVEGKEMDARAKVIFFQGDMVEMMLGSLAKLAGANLTSTGMQQAVVELNINGVIIKGHADGILVLPGEMILVEFKSMSDYGFERFEKGIVDDAYLAQANSYMEGLGLKRVLFVAQNKNSGVLKELLFERNEGIITLVKQNLELVLESSKESLPRRPYTPDDKGFYPWMCTYCNAHKTCLIDTDMAEKVVVRGAYKLKKKEVKISISPEALSLSRGVIVAMFDASAPQPSQGSDQE